MRKILIALFFQLTLNGFSQKSFIVQKENNFFISDTNYIKDPVLSKTPKFSFGLVGALPNAPLFASHFGMQGEYFFNERWFSSLFFADRMYWATNRWMSHHKYTYISGISNSFQLSFMGGYKLGRDKEIELTAGYTSLLSMVNRAWSAPESGMSGWDMYHFISIGIGDRFTFAKRLYLKPEILLNYRFGTTYNYKINGIKYQTNPFINDKSFRGSFSPQVRLTFAILLFKSTKK